MTLFPDGWRKQWVESHTVTCPTCGHKTLNPSLVQRQDSRPITDESGFESSGMDQKEEDD